jgi:hypothetical protein
MTTRSIASDDLEIAMRAVRQSIQWAERRGDGTGMPRLSQRLDQLSVAEAVGPDRLATLIDLVRTSTVASIEGALDERTKRRLTSHLRASADKAERSLDPWSDLDPAGKSERERTQLVVRRKAAGKMLLSCKRYAATGKTGFVRDAVKTLETYRAAEAATARLRLTASNAESQFARLGDALEKSMSPWAWNFFAPRLQAQVASEVEASAIRLGLELKARYGSWFGDAWIVAEPGDPPPRPPHHFQQDTQHAFNAYLAEVRRLRAAEKAEHAKRQRQRDEWEASNRRRAEEQGPVAEDRRVVEPDERRRRASPTRRPAPVDPPGYVQVETDFGIMWVTPEVAASGHLNWMLEQEWYRKQEAERNGKPYEPRYFARDPFIGRTFPRGSGQMRTAK